MAIQRKGKDEKQQIKLTGKLERRIKKLYRQSQKDIVKHCADTMHETAKRGQELYARYDKIPFAEKERKAAALATYTNYMKDQFMKSKSWRLKADKLAEDITAINKTATEYINGTAATIYANAYVSTIEAAGTSEALMSMGVSFEIHSKRAVAALAANPALLIPDDPAYKAKLPKYVQNLPKELRWNKDKISKEIAKGIIAGEKIDTIAERLRSVAAMDMRQSIMHARTMTGCALNKGRFDSMHDLEEMGVEQKKIWRATDDEKTRDSHRELDGKTAKLDEPFANGLLFPQDPMGDYAETMNCRCTLQDEITGFKSILPEFKRGQIIVTVKEG